MNYMNKNNFCIAAMAILLAGPVHLLAQDSTNKTLVVNLGYSMENNKKVYLAVSTRTKIDKKFQPVHAMPVTIYLDTDSAGNLVGKVVTDEMGRARIVIPPALKKLWESSPKHNFLAITESNKEYDATRTEATITKSKINIDTASDDKARNITVTVSALEGNEWVPAKDVEMTIGVKRSGGILSVSDEETYTTDSTGRAIAEFKKDSLPGDTNGNIILIAKVEDNDQYGSLVVEKTVPWGKVFVPQKDFFDQRTLWSTRLRTPPWLLFMAYSITIGIWSVIIYLVIQILKISKAGAS